MNYVGEPYRDPLLCLLMRRVFCLRFWASIRFRFFLMDGFS